MTEEKKHTKRENLYNTNHKTTTEAYRDNYDTIKWDDYTTDCTNDTGTKNR